MEYRKVKVNKKIGSVGALHAINITFWIFPPPNSQFDNKVLLFQA